MDAGIFPFLNHEFYTYPGNRLRSHQKLIIKEMNPYKPSSVAKGEVNTLQN